MCRRVDWILAEIVVLQQLIVLCAKAIHASSLANLGTSSPILYFLCIIPTSLLTMHLAEMVDEARSSSDESLSLLIVSFCVYIAMYYVPLYQLVHAVEMLLYITTPSSDVLTVSMEQWVYIIIVRTPE